MLNLVKVKALVPLAQVELPYSEGHIFKLPEVRANELADAGFVEIVTDNPENIEVIDAEEVVPATSKKPKK